MKEETLRRIEYDITASDLGKARDRLHGLIATYPNDLALRLKLGQAYWHLQYPSMAGRYWYLEEDKSPTMTAACQAFERSGGNSLSSKPRQQRNMAIPSSSARGEESATNTLAGPAPGANWSY